MLFTFVACGGDDDELPFPAEYVGDVSQYEFTNRVLTLGDTIVFPGLKNGYPFVGYYNEKTKQKYKEFVGVEKVEREHEIDEGYGNKYMGSICDVSFDPFAAYMNPKVGTFRYEYECKDINNESSSHYTSVSEIVAIDNNVIMPTGFKSPKAEIVSGWYENSIIVKDYENYYLYDLNSKKKTSLQYFSNNDCYIWHNYIALPYYNGYPSYKETCIPTSLYTYIYVYKSDGYIDLHGNYLRRDENDVREMMKYYWDYRIQDDGISSSDSKPSIDTIFVERKDGDIWDFRLKSILYSGDIKIKRFKLNVLTGESID
jgi:hypothetical protein